MSNSNPLRNLEYIRALTGPAFIKDGVEQPRLPRVVLGEGLSITSNLATLEHTLSATGGGSSAEEWSQYQATQQVEMDGNGIHGLPFYDNTNAPPDLTMAVSIETLMYVLSTYTPPGQVSESGPVNVARTDETENCDAFSASGHYVLVGDYITYYLRGTITASSSAPCLGTFDITIPSLSDEPGKITHFVSPITARLGASNSRVVVPAYIEAGDLTEGNQAFVVMVDADTDAMYEWSAVVSGQVYNLPPP